jgi:hypothetical protein
MRLADRRCAGAAAAITPVAAPPRRAIYAAIDISDRLPYIWTSCASLTGSERVRISAALPQPRCPVATGWVASRRCSRWPTMVMCRLTPGFRIEGSIGLDVCHRSRTGNTVRPVDFRGVTRAESSTKPYAGAVHQTSSRRARRSSRRPPWQPSGLRCPPESRPPVARRQ